MSNLNENKIIETRKERIKRLNQISEPIDFPATLIESSGTLRVTIPKREVDFNELEAGEPVRVWIKRK